MTSNAINNVEHVNDDELDDGRAAIEKLPDECILSIFDHLYQKSLLALTLVSKRFNDLADRSFRIKFAKTGVYIRMYPSLKVQKFGSSLTFLDLNFDVNEQIMEEICEFCPNLKKLRVKSITAQTFIRPFFGKMLSQIVDLDILKGFELESRFLNEFISALQCCKNLTTLALGSDSALFKMTAKFDPFLHIVFPQLYHVLINMDQTSSSAFPSIKYNYKIIIVTRYFT